jgi:LysR family transcriptional regulator for bpeEF and oprC
MDKLRAIEYFNSAVRARSFAAAARALDVSTPAVSQLIGALERSLGTPLFHRTSAGLALTIDGERYYAVTRGLFAGLGEVERDLGVRREKPRGTLAVGMRSAVGQTCVMPRIGRFLERHPEIELVTRLIESAEEIDRADIDLAVMIGWPPERGFVVRPLAQTRNVVCASPAYWRRAGAPRDPDHLRDHHCLVYRSAGGALLDRWIFEKDGERRSINVRTRVLSEHRTWLDAAACAGAGVIRLSDLTLAPYLSAGLLVPALTDWEAVDAPTIFAAYRPAQRRSKLVQAFVAFLVETFTELQAERFRASGRKVPAVPRPEWFGRARGRHSAYAQRVAKHR